MDAAPDIVAETATEYFKESFTEKAFDGNPVISDFSYTVDGDFYKMEGFDFPENYYNEVSLNANATETAVIIDQDEITSVQIKDIAVFLYERDSLYNFAYPCAFYVCTYDNFNNSTDFTYTYKIDVDTTTQTTTIYDANQNLIE